MATKPVEIEILMKDRLSSGLDKAGRKVDELKAKTTGASAEMERLDRQAESVRGTMSKIAGAFAAKELISNIVKVRGEFQQLEASFRTMLGSEEKADALMQQLIRTAATTPFDLQSVANGARQLLAYGENVENVNDDLIRLGNIAAGLNQPLSDLIYLYGTTMTQGRLYTADYNQFVGRGIPLGRELAGVLGVTESKVREMVEAGKVGFPEVQQALQNLTNEGGMFYNLMDEQSKTITGRISNIQDSFSMMLNEIGQQSEGIIGESLDAVSYLVDHYEQVGRVLLGLVGTYGAYKTAVMAVTAMQALQTAGVGALTAAETLHYGWLVLVEKAQKLLNATMLANPYVLVATLVAGVVAAMVSMKTETERLKEAEEEYQTAKQKTIEAEEEHRRRLEELCGVAGDESLATDTRREALNKLEQKYPDIFAKYDTEYEKLNNLKRIKEEIAELEAGQSITLPQNELDSVNARIAALEAKKTTERWEDANGSGTRMRKVGGLTGDETTELQNLYDKRKNLSEQVRKERANSYFENLTGISNDTLEQQIRQRENLLARMKTRQTQYGTISYGNPSLAGTYSRDELQYQLNKLNAEKNRRNLRRDSSADWGAQARKEYEEALKAYNDFLADTSNNLTREEYEKKAKELKDALSLAKKEYDKYKPGENKDAEIERKAADKAEKEAERRRQAEQKLDDDLTSLQQQSQQEELDLMDEGTEKKLAQIDADYEKRKAEIEKKARELADTNRKAGITDTNASGLTKEQQSEIDRAHSLNEDSRKKRISDIQDEETAAMNRYLAEYGTYQQRKLAITQEYRRKMTAATTEGDRLALQKEMEEALSALDMDKLKESINWELVFSDLGNASKKSLQQIKKQLNDFKESEEYQNMAIDQKKVIDESLNKIQSAIIDKGGLLGDLPEQLEELRRAQEELTAAQDEYNEALKNGTDDQKEAARKKLNKAEQNVANAQSNTDKAAQKTTDNLLTLADALTQLGGSTEMTLTEVGQVAGGIANAFSEAGSKIGGIIGAILTLLDQIGQEGLFGFLDNVLGSVGNALYGVFDSLLGWTGIDFGGESDEHLAEDIQRLTTSNQELENAINNLSDKMEDAPVAEVGEIYEQQRQNLLEQEKNTLEMMQRSAAAWSNGFLGIGGTHSSANKIDEGMSAADWQAISDVVGRTIQNAGDFFNLTSEEMWRVANEATTEYAKLKDLADNGYQNAAQFMDEYINYWKELEELEEARNEKLTSVSFDTVKDDFRNALLDMEDSTEVFADNFEKMMQQAILESMMTGLYDDALKEWYEAFAYHMDLGDMDTAQEELRKQWQEIVDSATAQWEGWRGLMGWESDGEGTTQSGKAGAYTAMSQEQGTKLEGLFTSGQMHWASIDEQMQDVSEQMGTAVDHLRRIEENTGNSARHLDEIKSDIKKIIRDGLKMK